MDAYELERRALEGQSRNWASEAAKATQEYAKLLGHQNRKQKIKRINQISEENMSLKQVLYDSHKKVPSLIFSNLKVVLPFLTFGRLSQLA